MDGEVPKGQWHEVVERERERERWLRSNNMHASIPMI